MRSFSAIRTLGGLLRNALPKFKPSVTLLCFALAVISLVWLWVWGKEWSISGVKPFETILSRLLITAFYLIVFISWAAWQVLNKLRRYEKQDQLKKQTEDDPLKAELVALQEYLSGWMAKLRQHYNQDEKFRYRLPWYVFIGDKSSGKSTLIREGVQRVSLSEADDDNSHCTNYVECYLTEQAVIFDIDGNLVNQHSVEEDTTRKFNKLWVALLEWFATERSRQPLNGVVITVDIHRFISSEQHQREQYIAMLRQRLADIERKLQCKLPVYIVLTRLDLFYGFEAMFQSLDKVQRDAILGVTFSTNATEWQQELDNFWHEWIKKINIALPEMMLNDVDSHQRSALFTFSRQMFGIKEYATWLLDALIYGQENILLRGIYLTSSVQKGQMDDIFVKSAAAQYHLSKQPYPTWQSVVNVPYFTRDLFKEVIFSEANLAGENRVYIQHAQSKVKIFGALCAVCVVGVWGAWQYYYRQNFQAGEMVLTQAKAFMNIPVPEGNDYYGNLQLPLLNPLGDAMFAYGNYHEHMPVLADAGLYQGYKIGPYIEKTYLSLLEQRFLPAIMDGLIGELKAAPAGSEQKLNILRIIRMIEDESGRNKKLVLSYMQERWSQRFPGQKDIQDHLWQHLDYALDHVQWKKDRDEGNKAAIDTFKPYSKTIADAQQELGKLSIYQRVYQNLRIKAGDALPQDLNLKTQIGATFDTVFIAAEEQKLRVPQFLTHSGLMNYYLEQNDQLIDLTSMDSWVLNLTNNVAYSDADRAEIHRQITEQYASDYISTWHSAIANISVREFTDISDAIRTLESTIGGEQPLKKTLLILKDNTQPAALVTEKDKSESNRDDQRLINRIYREFITETSVLDESNAQLSTMQNVTQKLSNLHRYLLSIQNAPEPGKAALKAVQLHLEQGSSDPVFELQQLAKTVPDPLGRWINELATQAWKVVVKTSVQSLETEWNEKVVKPFNLNLVDRYPFNATSKQDVALSEFEQFFRTGGTIDAFYQENLKFFMENGNLKEASLIRPDVIKQLAMAERIRKTFFGPQNELGIQYAIQPVDLSGSKRRAVMNLDGQLVEYSHGRANKVLLIWPNSMRESIESKVTLIPVTGQASKSISAAGVWAQFRLVNAGMLSNINGGSFDVRYTVDGGYVVYRIFVDSTENPFAGGLFTQFRLPETLY